MNKIKSAVMAIVIAVIGAFFVMPTVTAQESGNGLKISPTRTELVIERGFSDSVDITVENITELPIQANFFVNDFLPSDEGDGSPRIILDESSDAGAEFSIRDFIGQLEDVNLEPGEAGSVKVNIDVPQDAQPGSYFGVVRAAPEIDRDQAEGTQVGITASVGSIIIVTVPGDVVELLSLRDIAIVNGDSTGSFFESAPDSVDISLNNEGNIISKPFGKVVVSDWRGNTVQEYEINNQDPRGNVLPASFRVFNNELENIGSFGRYTVEANISYGPTGGSIITAETTFWVMPWKIMLVGVGILTVAAFGLTRGVKMYNSAIVNRSKSERFKK